MAVSAVATTGIYCRPGCTARPDPRNVSPYTAPIAAEAAGYRACLRCRPDRHLRSVEFSHAPQPVAAAVQLISDGFLDRFDEGALADRVGYSARQLRRLFDEHIGATPDFVARSRRAHFARRLLDESDLSMNVIAGASGFGSVRQMNRVVEQIFRFSPRDLRAKRGRRDCLPADGGLHLRLPFVGPLDLAVIRSHLGPRITAGVESLVADDDGTTTYRRAMAICGHPGVVELDLTTPDDRQADHLLLTAHLPTYESIVDEVARVRRFFGLDDDVEAANGHLADDRLLGSLVASRPGLRVVGGWDRFETVVRVIVGQQVSVAGASTVTARLAERYGMRFVAPALGLTHLFPDPLALVGLGDDHQAAMPRRRAATIAAVAQAVVDGKLDLHDPDPERFRAHLLALPGIGPWTADVVAMRARRDPDAFPAGDLGIRQAVARLTGADELPSISDLATRAEDWRPFRAHAAQHLWASLSAPVGDPP